MFMFLFGIAVYVRFVEVLVPVGFKSIKVILMDILFILSFCGVKFLPKISQVVDNRLL